MLINSSWAVVERSLMLRLRTYEGNAGQRATQVLLAPNKVYFNDCEGLHIWHGPNGGEKKQDPRTLRGWCHGEMFE
jgi:hypothetical protein